MIASQMFGGKEEEVLPVALALEVFHNFTLLHDDVMDKAQVRRGRATVHVKWNENTAILSGDQMIIEAYKLLAEVPADKLSKVLKMFNQMGTEICEGQQYDVDFESQEEVSIEEYLKMIRLKTAVLLANALKMGAYIAGAKDEQQEMLYEFGIHIGLAFQIQDDILDVWGNPETFGKAVGGDISCNKKTFVYLEAKGRLGDEARGDEAMRLEEWYSHMLEDNTEKIAAVKEIFEQLGVRERCEKVVEDYTQKALDILDKLPQNQATEQLRKLADKLNNRNS
jgi:geranylgeranyl diphosphate synthase type II